MAHAIDNAQRNLNLAKFGYLDMISEPRDGAPTIEHELRQELGLASAVVYGKSALDVLKTIRSVDRDRFEKWFARYGKLLTDDPLVKWFIDLRNQILKVRPPQVAFAFTKGKDSDEDVLDFGRLFFDFGDEVPAGAVLYTYHPDFGKGWIIENPDGTTRFQDQPSHPDLDRKYGSHLVFRDAPTEHMGKHLPDQSPKFLVHLFLEFVQTFVDLAKEDFATVDPPQSP